MASNVSSTICKNSPSLIPIPIFSAISASLRFVPDLPPTMHPRPRRLGDDDVRLRLQQLGPSPLHVGFGDGVPGQAKEDGVVAELGGSQPVVEPGQLAITALPGQEIEPFT